MSDDVRFSELCKAIVDANIIKKGEDPLTQLQQAVDSELQAQQQQVNKDEKENQTTPPDKPQPPPPAPAPKPAAKPTTQNEISRPAPVKTNTSQDNMNPDEVAKEQQKQPEHNYDGTNPAQKPNEPPQPFKAKGASCGTFSSLVSTSILEHNHSLRKAASYFSMDEVKDSILTRVSGYRAAVRIGNTLVPAEIETSDDYENLVHLGASEFYRMVKEATNEFQMNVTHGNNDASKEAAMKQIQDVTELLSEQGIECDIERTSDEEVIIHCACDDIPTDKLFSIISDALMQHHGGPTGLFDLSELVEGNLQRIAMFPMEK